MGEAVLSLVFLCAALTSSQTMVSPEGRTSGAIPTGSGRSTEANPGGLKIAAGTEIKATFDTPLSTKTALPGDVFTATITEPIRSANGDILIPAGSRLQGEVSEPDQGRKIQALRDKKKLSVRFSNIQIPDGSFIPLSARLISLEQTKDQVSAGSALEVQSSKTETTIAKDTGVNAAHRTAERPMFSRALKGLAIGPMAGGGYVLATNGKEVALPAHTRLTLRVDHDIFVSSHAGAR